MIPTSLLATGCIPVNFGVEHPKWLWIGLGVTLNSLNYYESVGTKFLPISRQSVSSFQGNLKA
jgi:hypothetical protein